MQNEIGLQPVSGEGRGTLDKLLFFVLKHFIRNAPLTISLHQFA